MIKAVDYHCHWNSEYIDLGKQIPIQCICPEDVNSSIKLLDHSHMYKTENTAILHAGLHPWLLPTDKNVQQELDKLRDFVNANRARVSAIGEIGLDKSRNKLELQKDVLKKQLDIAVENKISFVSLHCVRAYGSLLSILREFESLNFIIHGYRGNMQMSREIIKTLKTRVVFSFGPGDKEGFKEMVSEFGIVYCGIETDYPHTKRYPKEYAGKKYIDVLNQWYQEAAALSCCAELELKHHMHRNLQRMGWVISN